MSRLYDRLMRKGGAAFPSTIDELPGIEEMVSRTWDALERATVVDFTEVARHFLTVEERETWDCRDDFPGVALPLSPGFYEFTGPGYTYSKEYGRQPYDINAVGYLGQMHPYDEAQAEMLGAASWSEADPAFLVETMLVLEFRKGNPRIAAVVYWPLDADGRMMRQGDDALMLTIPLAAIGRDQATQERFAHELGSAKYPYLFGLSMLNCKNTRLAPTHPPRKLSRKHERRHGAPLTSYYTLEVEPVRSAAAHGGSGANRDSRALHIARGHFAHYSEDKPLFGKYVGTFWRPQHIRGSRKHGEVVKDYAVKAPQSPIETPDKGRGALD